MRYNIRQWELMQAVLAAVFILCCSNLSGQVLWPDLPENRDLLLSEEQFSQGHYAQAAESARAWLVRHRFNNEAGYTPGVSEMDKAHFLLAMACLKTNVPGGDDSANTAMETTSNAAYRQRLGFALAQYYFHRNQMAKAIPLYEAAKMDNLNANEVADGKFELAYCYFSEREFGKAEPLLASIKELKDSKYYLPANYYYGLLEYNRNRYKEALVSFDRVKEAKDYVGVVPYYIAEIYYFMGNREKALQWAEAILNSGRKSYYDKELHLLAAQCLFEQQRYAEAHPYFQYYYDHSDKIRKQDLYEMAYCDYKIEDWNSAIDKFKLLNSSSDSLGQTAMYLLGDCYLKTGDKGSARNAYGICADMTYNKGQQEAAMMLYSRLSYETGYNDEALRQLNALLKTFPSTQYRDEANTMISGLLVKTNNYEDALKHLEGVSRKEDDYWTVYQKANYGYAVQQYRKGDLQAAKKYFGNSLEHPINADYEGAAWFWRGEVAYAEHDYDNTISYSEKFLSHKGKSHVAHISPQATPQHAYLNMGYAALETHKYAAAQEYFNEAQIERGDDAYAGKIAAVREADAAFLQKNFDRAGILYDRIITLDPVNADYARYQKSILLGLQQRFSDKIALLQTLVSKAPPSAYANFARYEIALTDIELDKYPQAQAYLHQLTDSVADKSFAPKSWMKRGFIYQQTGDPNKAIEAYKHVVIDYPASEDRLPALDALKSLYIQTNQPAAYARLLKENNLPSAESSSLDSTYYAAAETQFANGNMVNAAASFSNYLREYPNGIFAIKAHYYRAESYFRVKKYSEAMDDYNVILSGPVNDFYENSAKHAATIAYEAKDFAKAFDYYHKLDQSTTDPQMKQLAYDGLVKSGFNSGRYKETALYADSLIATPGVSEELANGALYFKARSLQHVDSLDAAIAVYHQLSGNKNGDVAAESRYHIAEILSQQEKLKEAEDAANEAIHLSSGYDYWIAQDYLLLADVLTKEKDYFNAKALLESIVKHTKIADTKREAVKRLEEVKKLEKKQSKLSEEQ